MYNMVVYRGDSKYRNKQQEVIKKKKKHIVYKTMLKDCNDELSYTMRVIKKYERKGELSIYDNSFLKKNINTSYRQENYIRFLNRKLENFK